MEKQTETKTTRLYLTGRQRRRAGETVKHKKAPQPATPQTDIPNISTHHIITYLRGDEDRETQVDRWTERDRL